MQRGKLRLLRNGVRNKGRFAPSSRCRMSNAERRTAASGPPTGGSTFETLSNMLVQVQPPPRLDRHFHPTAPASIVCLLFCLGLLCGGGCAPVDPEATLRQAVAAMKEGRWKEATELSRQCLHAAPGDVKLRIMHGISLAEAGRSDDALEALEEAARRAPGDFFAQYYYGWALCETGRFGDAMAPLRRAYEHRSEHPEVAPDVMVLLSRCCMEQNLEEGIRYLMQLRDYRAFGRRPEVYNALGILFLNKGETGNAKQSFLHAHARDRENPVVAQNLAILYDYYLRDPAEAMRYYRDALHGKQLSSDSTGQAAIRERLRQLARERAVEEPEEAPPLGTAPVRSPSKAPAPVKKPQH